MTWYEELEEDNLSISELEIEELENDELSANEAGFLKGYQALDDEEGDY